MLVTGHTGFKGVWLTLLLESLGIQVAGYSLPPRKDSLFELIGRRGKIQEELADITNITKFKDFVQTIKPCAIIHLAAQPLVLESYKKPVETFTTNVLGTASVLEAAFHQKSVKVVAAITTDKVYHNQNLGRRFIETDPLQGKDPYSASKVGSEAVISAWQQIQKISGGPTILALRAGNVIGGGDMAPNRLIPDLVRAVQDKTQVRVRSPKSTRPWQHVVDPLVGYIMAIEKSFSVTEHTSYNFGPVEKSLEVNDVINIFRTSLGADVNIVVDEEKSDLESKTLDLDSSRANNHLHWFPICEQKEAIALTFEWWNDVLNNGEDPEEVTNRNISELLSRLK